MSTTPRPSWPAPPPLSAHDAAALARFEGLPAAERARVARLVALTGAPLALAVAAVEATRTTEESTHNEH